jgi:hypothetical protein
MEQFSFDRRDQKTSAQRNGALWIASRRLSPVRATQTFTGGVVMSNRRYFKPP